MGFRATFSRYLPAYYTSFLALTSLVCFALLLMLSVPVAAQSNGDSKDTKRSDVRLLIDISGSMKKNDPNNLRIPALKIVTNLMPKGSDSGVWTFGKFVNMLVPLKRIDEAWQRDAAAAADKVNSAGLFTNIGDAMTKSTWDWTRLDPTESRSMILLTDGKVDISKSAAENKAERNRILTQVLPKLKSVGVTIHTIALSNDADVELLSTMANETDGWFQAVNDAEQLQRVFLKIFEQATPRDSLPLENNRFKVDASVEEMTLLVFREGDSEAAKLYQPDGKAIDQQTSNTNVRWFATDSYDLITVQKPPVGDWQVDANVDPDNRVMVVSKLGLQVEDLPNNVMANEQIRYGVTLLEDGKVITRPDFLNLIDAKLETEYQDKINLTPLLLDTAAGRFQQIFFAGDRDGVLNIRLVVKSPTFERSRTHAINIYGTPVSAELVQAKDEMSPHKVMLSIAEEVVDLSTLRVTGKVTYPDDSHQFLSFESWQPVPVIELRPFADGGDYKVELKASGSSMSGRSFSAELPNIEFSIAGKQVPEPVVKQEVSEPVVEKTVERPAEKPVVEETVPVEDAVGEEPEEALEENPPIETEPATEEPVNWILWLSIGIVGNLVLFVGGWFVWRMLRKKDGSKNEELTQALFDDDDESDAAETEEDSN